MGKQSGSLRVKSVTGLNLIKVNGIVSEMQDVIEKHECSTIDALIISWMLLSEVEDNHGRAVLKFNLEEMREKVKGEDKDAATKHIS